MVGVGQVRYEGGVPASAGVQNSFALHFLIKSAEFRTDIL